MLARPENLDALAGLPGRWIDAVHDHRPPRSTMLDMESSESPVHGDQERSAWNGHFQSKCLHPLSCSTSSVIWRGSLTSLRERLIKTGTRLVRHARYAVFQMAEAALPRQVFAGILTLINGLHGPPAITVSA
jgi:hypothetical protein